MANVIKIKRGASVPTTLQLTEGELGFDTSNNDLYIGTSNSVVKIGTDTSRLVQKSGDTMTGVLSLAPNIYTGNTGALDMQNSNIYNLNAIYTADAAGAADEGIHFYRDSTHVDTLWVNDGDLLFVPNKLITDNTTKANSQKVARFTANPTTGQLVLTDGTTGGLKALTASATNIVLPSASINIQRVGLSTSWHKGRDNAIIKQTTISGYSPMASIKTNNGSWDFGVYNVTSYADDLLFSYVTDTKYNGSSAAYDAQIKFLENGHIVAALDGNATSATTATNATYFSSSSYNQGTNNSVPVYLSGGKITAFGKSLVNLIYPVGSIYMSATLSTAAAVGSALGGTWVAWGSGRVPVGVNTSDTDFNSVEKTGGEKTHTLTTTEMPAHSHTGKYINGDGANNGSVKELRVWSASGDGSQQITNSVGGGGAHNNLQPYITCYMYKRTA